MKHSTRMQTGVDLPGWMLHDWPAICLKSEVSLVDASWGQIVVLKRQLGVRRSRPYSLMNSNMLCDRERTAQEYGAYARYQAIDGRKW